MKTKKIGKRYVTVMTEDEYKKICGTGGLLYLELSTLRLAWLIRKNYENLKGNSDIMDLAGGRIIDDLLDGSCYRLTQMYDILKDLGVPGFDGNYPYYKDLKETL